MSALAAPPVHSAIGARDVRTCRDASAVLVWADNVKRNGTESRAWNYVPRRTCFSRGNENYVGNHTVASCKLVASRARRESGSP